MARAAKEFEIYKNRKDMKDMRLIVVAMVVAAGVLAGCSGKAEGGSKGGDALPEFVAAAEFDADSAYQFIARQVEMGPRVPGSAAHARCHQWIVDRLTAMGATVELHDTTVVSPAGKAVKVRNIRALVNPQAHRRVMLAAHYDTRPWADRDSDPANYHTPIDGANDGASGVAVILELLRNYPASSTTGLEILLLDQEDSGSYTGDDREWCLGSQAYAAKLGPLDRRPDFGVLLDMVGGRGATFPREYFSQAMAPQVNNRVWGAASAAGQSSRFPDRVGGAVNDDHVYLLEAGIPIVDIIESHNPATGSFNPTWHTLDDTLDNIDRATLASVGAVVTQAIYR